MKNVGTVFKKEMRRFFTDPRMLVSLFLPGILIFVLYSLMGNIIQRAVTEQKIEHVTYNVAYTNNGSKTTPVLILGFQSYMGQASEEKTNEANYYPISVEEVDAAKAKVAAGEYDVLCVFSDDFETKIADGPQNPLSNYIHLFYDGSTAKGTRAYQVAHSLVDLSYKSYVINIDSKGNAIEPNLAKTDYTSSRFMSILVPMLTMSMLFSSVVAICPDTVAGEKERGTLSAMLLTPIKRSELAFGKILALSVTAALSGLTSFLGLLGGLPALMKGVNFSFTTPTIAMLAVLIVTTLIFFVSLGTLVSTLSKTSKECSGYLAPFMIISMAAALLPLAINTSQIAWAFVPLVNVGVCMNVLISSGTISLSFIGITVGMNMAFVALLIFATAHLFNSERFMVK